MKIAETFLADFICEVLYLKLILILGKRKADPKINKSIKTTKAQDSNPSPVEFLEIFYCIVRLMHLKAMFHGKIICSCRLDMHT